MSAIQTGDTSASILERADEALYASKNAGRNCGHFHDGRVSRLLSMAFGFRSIIWRTDDYNQSISGR